MSSTSSGSRIEAGGSGISQYSPISTLERQSQTNRILIFVQTNPNCCLLGGVEYILKQQRTSPTSNPEAPLTTSAVESANGHAVNAETASSTASDASDPFSFLNDPDQSTATTETSDKNKSGPNIGRFLKKVAKTTSKSLERGMQNLAIRADQGRNRDLLTVGLYDSNNNTLLSLSESQALPDEANRLEGIRFVVPLVSVGQEQEQISIKLWIQSGATLLQQTKAAKNYLIGSAVLSSEALVQAAERGWGKLNVTLQSSWVVDGHLQLRVVQDCKFPTLCGRGWSLVDPNQQQQQDTDMFNLPLDQSYAFDSNAIATERTVESTMVLPIATAFADLAAAATQVSLQHAQTCADTIQAHRHDVAMGEHAVCQVQVGALQTASSSDDNATMMISWQRPDSIFEVELAAPGRLPVVPTCTAFQATQNITFYPKPRRQGILPALMQTWHNQLPPHGFLLGNVRMQITVPQQQGADNPFGPTMSSGEEVWDCLVSLDSLLMEPNKQNMVLEYPVFDVAGKQVGKLPVLVSLTMQQAPVPSAVAPAARGLVALVGLPQVLQDVYPPLDYDPVQAYTNDPDRERRRLQLATMGYFVTFSYMDHHVQTIRSTDALHWNDRAAQYNAALQQTSAGQERPPPHQDRSPRPFRPSSSRSTILLANIPFNVHTASLSLDILNAQQQQQGSTDGAVFYNTTCGAPADHARGFANIFPKNKDPSTQHLGLNSPVGPVSGGIRRLESKRQELAALVANLQTTLVCQIANFFVEKRQIVRSQVMHHVPPRHAELADLRWKLYEAVQSLHHVTWACAMRRSVVFSQALGIAISSYLTSLSDPARWQSTWPEAWKNHGHLLCFEGLLSAAGKELGMIEDASVGISMLSMVQVVIVPDNGAQPPQAAVPVPGSPYLQWIHLIPSGASPEVEYTLQIGVVQSYYDQRIPSALKNGTRVRLYPLLFEVGVDIRQWGAHAGSNVKTSIEKNLQTTDKTKEPTGGLLEDEDDDVGVTDNDLLVQLNYEAFQKLNAYAHAISPANSQTSSAAQKTHPLLETLYQHIQSSAGRINHDIVDEAASIAQQLGGGGIVFCKSGKDRTAMHVTFKQAQFATRFRQSKTSPDGAPLQDSTIQDATLMRIYGTRLPVCEKNVGQAKYAFNSLQVKFMPDALKPPMSTLAGFLKGGKVFTGGGIES